MEFAKEIIGILSSIIVLLLGGGGILYYSVNKRLKNIQADREASAEWQKLYETKLEECKTMASRKEELHELWRKALDDANSLKIALAHKDVEIEKKNVELVQKDLTIARITYDKCVVTGCKRREPKRNEINDIA